MNLIKVIKINRALGKVSTFGQDEAKETKYTLKTKTTKVLDTMYEK